MQILQFSLSEMLFILVPHLHLATLQALIISSKTFFPIWKSSDSLKSWLNSYASFCKLFVAICLPHLTVKLLGAERKLSAFACLTIAQAAWHISSWKFVEWRHKCSGHRAGGPAWETTGEDKSGETMSAFR